MRKRTRNAHEKFTPGQAAFAGSANTCSLSPLFHVPSASRCAATPPPAPARRTLSQPEETPMSPVTTASGLTIEDTVIGEGAAAAAGRDVIVHYAGWLADGTQFDSSKEKQDTFQFTLGKKEDKAGWEA